MKDAAARDRLGGDAGHPPSKGSGRAVLPLRRPSSWRPLGVNGRAWARLKKELTRIFSPRQRHVPVSEAGREGLAQLVLDRFACRAGSTDCRAPQVFRYHVVIL